MEAAQVSVVVISARELHSKKRDACLASVVFGIGSDLFGTEVVESNDPVWNQEANFDVSKKSHSTIKFKIRDKDTTIGAIHLPVDNLPTIRPGASWYPLEPYKKITAVHGQVCAECWISKTQPVSSMPSSRETSIEDFPSYVSSQVTHMTSQVTHLPGKVMDYLHLNKRSPNFSKSHQAKAASDSQTSTPYSSDQSLRQAMEEDETSSSHGSNRPMKPQQSDSSLLAGQRRDSASTTPPSPPSVPDTATTTTSETGEPSPPPLPVSEPPMSSVPMKDHKMELDDHQQQQQQHADDDDVVPPEVSGISPNEGDADGGTRVTLRGINLGTGAEDVVMVMLAGVDCTATLEYLSPVKLVVTTLPSSGGGPMEGPVTIKTLSGGEGTSTLHFHFIKEEVAKESTYGSRIQTFLESPFVSKKKVHEETEVQSELKQVKNQLRDLKDENISLKEENKSLQEYIDKLLLVVMNAAPDALATN